MDLQGVGSRIKNLRGEMSQRKFAQIVNLGQTYISEMELSKLKPSLEALHSISEYCGVSIDYILKGSEFVMPRTPSGLNLGMQTLMAKEAINHLDNCAKSIKKLDVVAIVGIERLKEMENKVVELETDPELHEALLMVRMEGGIAN